MIWTVLNKTLNNVWPMLTIFLVVIIACRIAYLANHREKVHFYKEFIKLIFVIYILILYGLLTNTEINNNGGMNLVPFSEIFRYELGSELFIFNVLGNILIFLPFGYFISNFIDAKKIWPVIFVTLITSATVEFVQLQIGRSFDIDDILLNVLGAICGFLVHIALTAVRKHLPAFMQKDFVYNMLCIIIIAVLVFGIINKFGIGFGV